jgi:hypothetical protein
MSDTSTELQLARLTQLAEILDRLKIRFQSLTDAGEALERSIVTATISFLSTPRIAPVFVPNPATQSVNASPGAGVQGGVGDILVNTGKKAGEKLFDKLLDKLIEKAIGKKTPEDLPTKTKNPIGFARDGEAAVMPSTGKSPSFLPASWLDRLAGTGRFGSVLAAPVSSVPTRTTIPLAGITAAAAYGITTHLNKGTGGTDKTVQDRNVVVPKQQAASVMAALPVFVTNWPASFGRQPAGEGTKGYLEKARDKAVDTVIDAGIKAVLANAWKTLFGTMGLGGAVAATTIATLPVTLPAAAYGVSRMQQQESAGLVKWRTEYPQDYARQKEIWGIKPVNHAALPAAARGVSRIQQDESAVKWSALKFGGGVQLGSMINDLLHPSETQAQNQNIINIALRVDKDNRLYADTNDMGTAINLKRGNLGSIGD